jgi:hypothetical protein
MGWDSGFVKLGLHTVRGVLRSVGGRVPKKRYKELVSGVVAGVLAEHPDLDLNEARKRAERATGNTPAADLIASERSTPTAAKTRQPASRSGAKKTTKKKTTTTPRRRPPAPAGSRSTTARRNTRKPTARKRTTRKTTRR